jgi:hypothetical protein
MGAAEQTAIMELAASVEASGACTTLHLWAMAGVGKTRPSLDPENFAKEQ